MVTVREYASYETNIIPFSYGGFLNLSNRAHQVKLVTYGIVLCERICLLEIS